MKSTPACPYCSQPAKLVTGATIYPHRHDLHSKKFWNCAQCRAHVGCHPNTSTALGRLANAELRKLKMAAHAAFDPLWRSRRMHRAKAYAWLAAALGIEGKDCHIGMFDEYLCRRVVEVVREKGK